MAEALGSEEVLDFPCSPCQRENKGREAVVGCTTCQQYFCRECSQLHGRMLPDHGVVQRNDLKHHNFVQLTERCPKHQDEVNKMYCPSCDEVTCSACIAQTHRSCQAARYIPIEFRQLLRQPDVINMPELLEQQIKNLHIGQTVLQQHLQKLEVDQANATSALQKMFRELVAILESHMNTSIKKVEAKSHQLSIEIQNQLFQTEGKLGELQKFLEKLQSSSINDAQRFVAMKQYKPKLQEAETLNESILNSNGKHGLTFCFDPKLKECLTGTNPLGIVKTKDLHLYQRKGKALSRSIEEPGNDTCSISSCCFMDNGNVVLADRKNKILKLLDGEKHVRSSHLLDEEPCAVCRTNPNEVVVCTDKRSVQIFQLDDGFTRKGMVKMNHDCMGIAFSNGEMFISDGGKHVHVYNTNASFLRSLGPTSKREFNGTQQLTFNADGTKLFVVNKRMLICVDRLGNELFFYWDKEIQNSPLCSDGSHGFFVNETWSSNIYQFGANGKKMGKVMTESGNRSTPQAMCFNPTTKQLIVAYKSKLIQVYDLV